MKRILQICGILSIGLFGYQFTSDSGEKEELQLQQGLLNERLGRLSAEYNVTQYQLQEITKKIEQNKLDEQKKLEQSKKEELKK